jgi:aromatic ring-opening dioxygenase LigB subunit
MGELIAFIRRELEASGVSVDVADRIKSSVEQQFRGERLYIGAPKGEAKRAILEYGSSVPATYIARQLGVTVRHVRKVRQLLK